MGEKDVHGRRVKTSETVFGVVETLRELDGATISEVANEMNLAVSTAHAHLWTLQECGYVVKTDDEFSLSLKFLDYGNYVKNRYDIAKLAQPILDQLADETQESTWLVVEENGMAVFLAGSISEHGVAVGGSPGSRVPLHWIAAGKAIIAEYPTERVEEIIDQHGLANNTPSSVTDRDKLLAELEDIREQGFASGYSEYFEGLNAIGAPIMDDDRVLAAISIAGPSNRLQGHYLEVELPELLLGTVNEIEIKYASESEHSSVF